ncbi:GTP cyclohydrolase I [Curtobacterium sp. Leaf261]|uniref:GTP cyclohydrolase I n=1 Tax=Curtobacterium sp. Leaf261 TaxID=1736311 RepID=UPI000B2BC209|nr:GTP cyclohydrolase I [Curtobacterium sp. Leaf261]
MHPDIDRPRLEAAVRELLAGIGEDVSRPGLERTPARVAEAYAEFFAGLGVDATAIVRDGAVPAGPDDLGEIVVVRDIRFRSVCEHHLLPFLGVAHLAYVPGERIIGLGTLSKVVDAIASRPQLQERLGEELVASIADGLGARGVLVVLDAEHGCVRTRGERQSSSSTVTMAATGLLEEPLRRAEVVALIGAPRTAVVDAAPGRPSDLA